MFDLITFITTGLAVIINFYSPKLPTFTKSNRSDLVGLGFPYFYYSGESLSEFEQEYRVRQIYLNSLFGGAIVLSGSPLFSMGLPFIPSFPPIELLVNNQSQSKSQFRHFLSVAPSSVFETLPEGFKLSPQQINQVDSLALQVQSGSITVDEAVLKLRGGEGLNDLGLIYLFLILINWLNGVKGFQMLIPQIQPALAPTPELNPPRPRLPGPTTSPWWENRRSTPGPSTSREMRKPSSIPQGDYEILSTSEKRLLDDPQDKIIPENQTENRPRLRLAFNQVRWKTPKHGKIHGLPVDDNGKASKDDANILLNKLEQDAYNSNTEWYKDGSYQDQPSVNLYSSDTGILTVYKKINNENIFLTTLKMTKLEQDHFKNSNSGKFVSEKILLNLNFNNNNNNNNN